MVIDDDTAAAPVGELGPHRGRWVALTGEKVVESASTVAEIFDQAAMDRYRHVPLTLLLVPVDLRDDAIVCPDCHLPLAGHEPGFHAAKSPDPSWHQDR